MLQTKVLLLVGRSDNFETVDRPVPVDGKEFLFWSRVSTIIHLVDYYLNSVFDELDYELYGWKALTISYPGAGCTKGQYRYPPHFFKFSKRVH